MKTQKNCIIRTNCGKSFDLAKAAPLASDKSNPFGSHNFIVYKTLKGFYLKGYNTENPIEMINAYELISRSEAMYYLQIQGDAVFSQH